MSDRAIADLPARPGLLLAGRYLLGEPIGRGGSSVVYRAEDRLLSRPVALKVPRAPLDAAAARRFAREARMLAGLVHPNLPAVYDAGEERGLPAPYLVMELVEGPTLADFAVPVERVEDGLRWAIQVCRALAHLHGNGIVHGDVRLRNILITSAGRVKLVDLGLAEATPTAAGRAGRVAGASPYLAPEVAAGAGVTPAADLYAFGVAIYRLITARLPFEAGDVPPPPSAWRAGLSPALDALLLRLLERDPQRRADGADAVARDLEAILGALKGR